MSFYRVWAVFLRYFYNFGKMDSLAELFYWPTIDIFLWGMTSIWIESAQSGISFFAHTILIGVVLWQMIWRSHYEITVNILQEFWNRNLVNLFSTPLKLVEWMMATALIGIMKITITLGFSSLLVWLLFHLNVFVVGWVIIPAMALLIISGWWMAYISGGIMLYYGQRLQMLAWMTPFVFAPFSAIFYPVSALPPWAQSIAHCLPTTYVFEGVRLALYEGIFPGKHLLTGLALDLVFLCVSMTFFKIMFEKSRVKGLSRLE